LGRASHRQRLPHSSAFSIHSDSSWLMESRSACTSIKIKGGARASRRTMSIRRCAKAGQPAFAGEAREASRARKSQKSPRAAISRPIKSSWPCSVTLAGGRWSKMRGLHRKFTAHALAEAREPKSRRAKAFGVKDIELAQFSCNFGTHFALDY